MITTNVIIDEKNKFVKVVWSGKVDPGKAEEANAAIKKGCDDANNAMMKFTKGEPLCLVDTVNMDMRFLSPEAQRIVYEKGVEAIAHCKKIAQVVTGLILEKSVKNVGGGSGGNNRMFDSEQEAMKWLLE